jgi:serine/threonine protein kinase
MTTQTTHVETLPFRGGRLPPIERCQRELLRARVIGGRTDPVLIGPYVLEAKVGSGSMGEVFKAHHVVTNETVALKVLKHNRDCEIRRFEREAKMLSQLANRHLVQYSAHGISSEGMHYLAMEWLDGEDLHETLSRGPLSLRDSFAVALGIARGLSDAHEAGLVHRDIKPSNIFLVDGDPDQVKILDFGLVRPGQDLERITATGVRVGTPAYMSCEQLMGERDLQPAADVYALGVLLFECLSGHRPLGGSNLCDLVKAVMDGERPRVSEAVGGVPAGLDELIISMLAVDPSKRPRDARAVGQALMRYAA